MKEPKAIISKSGLVKYRKKRRGNGWKNHPKKGSIIASEPFRDTADIQKIKDAIDNPRELALFTIGINTAFRAYDLCQITAGNVRNLVISLSYGKIKLKKFVRSS